MWVPFLALAPDLELSAHEEPGKQQVTAQALVSLSPMREMHMESQAPGCGLSQPWLYLGSDSVDARSLSLCLVNRQALPYPGSLCLWEMQIPASLDSAELLAAWAAPLMCDVGLSRGCWPDWMDP